MTRCECAGVAFSEVARLVLREGRPLDDVLRRTGCGQNCGACRPDLARYLTAAVQAEQAEQAEQADGERAEESIG